MGSNLAASVIHGKEPWAAVLSHKGTVGGPGLPSGPQAAALLEKALKFLLSVWHHSRQAAEWPMG